MTTPTGRKPKKEKPTTKWWTANGDDARQIALRFHGNLLLSDGVFDEERKLRFNDHHELIAGAIVGEPKKRIMGIVEWVLGLEKKYEEMLAAGETPEPFVAAQCFDSWAHTNRAGKYAGEEGEEDVAS